MDWTDVIAKVLVPALSVAIAVWAAYQAKKANSTAQDALTINRERHEYEMRPILEIMSFDLSPSSPHNEAQRDPKLKSPWGDLIFRIRLKNFGGRVARNINLASGYGNLTKHSILLSPGNTVEHPIDDLVPGESIPVFLDSAYSLGSQVIFRVTWQDESGKDYCDTFLIQVPAKSA